MRIVVIGSFGSSGDQHYRVHQPAAALAALSGVEVFEVHPAARHRDAAALAADLLVLTMTLDLEAFRLIRQRRLLGRPTVVEVNDYLPDVQAWNPAASTWRDPRGHALFQGLIRAGDACQFSSHGLAERLEQHTRCAVVFPNHLEAIPPFNPQKHSSDAQPLRIGWGGSIGHLDDLRSIAPALQQWLTRRDEVQLEIMADPSLAAVFGNEAGDRLKIRAPGSLQHYRSWLNNLHIGLAPLLPTDYNRCRSDVKFLEYAAAGAAAVLQNETPYRALAGSGLANLVNSPEELIEQLDRLVQNPEQRLEQARRAHAHVSANREIQAAVVERQTFYSGVLNSNCSVPGPLPESLQQQRALTLTQIPGWERLGERHWRLDLSSNADQCFAKGLEALQGGHWSAAADLFQATIHSAPDHAPAHTFLGLCAEKRGQPEQAIEAFRSAHQLDPLALRPRRGLERPHRGAFAEARQLERQGDAAAAEQRYRAILDQLPSHSGALLQLATLLQGQGHTEQATGCLEQLLHAHPDHLHGHTNQSILFSAQSQWPHAEAACRRALAIDPDFPPALRQRHHLAARP
jgi:tetratricopeptide (TPR) repeat protein